MLKNQSKQMLKYLLQLLLLTFPLVTVINVLLLIFDHTPLFPFASGICMFTTWINLFMNSISMMSDYGSILGFFVIIIGEIPCILIVILYITAFLGIKNKKDRALTYLQFLVIIEILLISTNHWVYPVVYGVLALMLVFRRKYLTEDEPTQEPSCKEISV